MLVGNSAERFSICLSSSFLYNQKIDIDTNHQPYSDLTCFTHTRVCVSICLWFYANFITSVDLCHHHCGQDTERVVSLRSLVLPSHRTATSLPSSFPNPGNRQSIYAVTSSKLLCVSAVCSFLLLSRMPWHRGTQFVQLFTCGRKFALLSVWSYCKVELH